MQDKLKPKYGLVTTITLVVGCVVGVGIFLRAPRMSLSAGGDISAVLTAWVIAGLMILPIAIIISEIGAMSRRSGGIQVYGEETWSKRFGFGIGWAQAFFYIPANTVFMLYITADYTLKVTGMTHLGFTGIIWLGTFYGLCIFGINSISGKLGGQIQVFTTFVKVIPLILIGVVGSLYFGEPLTQVGENADALETFHANANLPFLLKVAGIIPAALFAFDGWLFVGVVSKEVKNPGRNLPLSIIGGLSVISLLYILFSYASFNVATPEALATEGVLNSDIASRLFGQVFGNVINVFILVSALGVANANTLALVRAPYSLAMSRKFPGSAWLARINPKTDMPTNSGLLAGAVTLGYLIIPFLLGWHNNGDTYGLFTDASVLLFFFFMAVICLGVVRMRKTHPNLQRPFRAPAIHVFMAMGLIGASFGIYSLFTAYASSLMGVVLWILFALSGFVVFKFTKEN